MHEDAGQVELHLETHIHIGAVDGRGPPQREATVWDLVQTTALCIGQLLVLPAGAHHHTSVQIVKTPLR